MYNVHVWDWPPETPLPHISHTLSQILFGCQITVACLHCHSRSNRTAVPFKIFSMLLSPFCYSSYLDGDARNKKTPIDISPRESERSDWAHGDQMPMRKEKKRKKAIMIFKLFSALWGWQWHETFIAHYQNLGHPLHILKYAYILVIKTRVNANTSVLILLRLQHRPYTRYRLSPFLLLLCEYISELRVVKSIIVRCRYYSVHRFVLFSELFCLIFTLWHGTFFYNPQSAVHRE